MSVRSVSVLLLVALVTASSAALAQPPAGKGTLHERTGRALAAATEFLLAQISEEGPVEGEYSTGTRRPQFYGGKTALVTYALLAAKVSPQEPRLRRAIEWLTKAKLAGTYAISLRACAMSELNNPKVLPLLRRDARWLMAAADNDGAYGYGSMGGKPGGSSDNSNTQFAVLGLWAAAKRGVKVPKSFWQRAERHWLNCQQADGGWHYRSSGTASSYGSMTAAGLASLFITFDAIGQSEFLKATAQTESQPIADGLKWMEGNFSAKENPGKSHNWWYYWLYSVERVARASGYKRFGPHDWYKQGAEALLARQDEDGSWHDSGLHQTAFALLFLARGRSPIMANKLKYRGRWNARPRDLANLTEWLSWNFERPVAWQIVDVDSPLATWQDAPILYISGAGPCEFSPEQLAKLRDFVHQGGLILSEAAGNNGDFTMNMRQAYRQILPHLKLAQLAADHPLHATYFKQGKPAGLLAVSNGLRPLVIHSPGELSRALQRGQRKATESVFQMLANIYLYVTDKGNLLPRGVSYWPEGTKLKPSATIAIARLKYDGNWNPEPQALARLAIRMGRRYSIKLDVTPPVEIELLKASHTPLVVMTGTDAIDLTETQTVVLKRFFADGGTLIIDAAGGSRRFDQSVRQQILPLPADAVTGPISTSHKIFAWPNKLDRPEYRRDFALALGPAKGEHRLEGVLSGDRLAIVYSGDDLTAGLVGYRQCGLRGYSPNCAADLMTNIICYAAQANNAAAPASAKTPKATPAAPAPSH